MRVFPSCGEQGLLFFGVHELLTVLASFVAEHRLQAWDPVAAACGLSGVQASVAAARGLHSPGSVVVVHGLTCSLAGGMLLNQGSNPCLPH